MKRRRPTGSTISSEIRPEISVVTPVFNGAAYLAEAIESVLAQTTENLELVILDNASTDATPDILADYAARDSRIRTHRNTETLPVIRNWNQAMELIDPHSRYCRVLHADDTMDPRYLEKTVAVAERHPNIGIVGCLRDRGDTVQCGGLATNQEAFDGKEVARLFLRGEVYAFAPTSDLLRADLVRNRRPFYPEAYLHADLAAYFELLTNCDFGFVHERLAFSRVHEQSITATVAERDQTILREWLAMLLQYGPAFFEAEEMARLERRFLRQYYRVLLRGAVTGRGRDFLSYHLTGLRQLGRAPGLSDYLQSAVSEAAAAVAHPDKLIRHLRH